MKEVGKKASGNLVNSPRVLELKKRNRKIYKIKVAVSIFLTLLLLVGAVMLSRWPEVNATIVEISGNKIIDTAVLEQTIREELDGYYVFVIPKSNILVLPKEKIKARLAHDFKRLESIDIKIKDGNKLVVTVMERKAEYTWCGEDPEAFADSMLKDNDVEGKCYFINENGYIFDKAPYFSGDVYFKFFGELENKDEPPLGQNYLPQSFVNTSLLVEDIKSFGLKPVLLFAKPDGDMEIYLKSNAFNKDEHRIIFDPNAELAKTLENLHASITTNPLKSDLKKRYDDLLYIDLRFGNKIYYKFR